MKARKWTVWSLILVLVFAAALTGCGAAKEEAKEPAKEGDKPAEQEKVTITLAGWGSSPEEQELLTQTLDEFRKANPNIQVKHEVIPDQYMDVIKTRLIGGEAPDVFYLDSSEAPGIASTGVLEPLDGYVTNEFDVADFEQPLLNAFKWEGKTYGFPKDYSTLAMFYNKKMFADVGIPAPPKTWEEFLDAAKQLTKDTNGDGKVDQYGFAAAPELARQFYMAKAFGGNVVDENGNAVFASPEALKGLQLIIDQHLVDKTSAQPSEVGAGWGGEMFGQGKSAMVFEGNWAIPYLQNNFKDTDFGTAELPTVNGKQGTMAFTVAYVMNKESKQKEAAWKLISYLTGKEGMKTWTSKGFALPTRKSVAAELGFDKDELRGALVAGASYATPWQAGTTLPTIATNFNNMFVSAFLGEQPLEDAMKKGQETANKEIQAGK
jgi:multiple sugar transport system substrate-binding protein